MTHPGTRQPSAAHAAAFMARHPLWHPLPHPLRTTLGSTSLELMRELQRHRQRAKGVSLEIKSSEEAEAVGDEGEEMDGERGLESTFTAQARVRTIGVKCWWLHPAPQLELTVYCIRQTSTD
mgnify:CR=1 FL=1|jgi:hypothetical protein